MRHISALLVFVLACVSCGGRSNPITPSPTPTPPPPAPILTGTWTGVAEEKVYIIFGATFGTVRVTLTQTGSSVSGQWSLTYPNTAYNSSGSVAGSLAGTALSLVVTPSLAGACPSRVTATHTSPTIRPMYIEGTYAGFNCTVATGGTVILQQQ